MLLFCIHSDVKPAQAQPECYIAMRMYSSTTGIIDVYSKIKTVYQVTEEEKVSRVSLGKGFSRYCVATLCPESVSNEAIEVWFEIVSGVTRCVSEGRKYLVRPGDLRLFTKRSHCESGTDYNLISGSCQWAACQKFQYFTWIIPVIYRLGERLGSYSAEQLANLLLLGCKTYLLFLT